MSRADRERQIAMLMEAERDVRLALEPYFPEGTPGDLVAGLGRVTGRLVARIAELENKQPGRPD